MNCPNCNSNDYYEGIMGPNCINQNCCNFKGVAIIDNYYYYFSYDKNRPNYIVAVKTNSEGIVLEWAAGYTDNMPEFITNFENGKIEIEEEERSIHYLDWFKNNYWIEIYDKTGTHIDNIGGFVI